MGTRNYVPNPANCPFHQSQVAAILDLVFGNDTFVAMTGKKLRYGQIGRKCRFPSDMDATKTQARGRISMTNDSNVTSGNWQLMFPNTFATALTGEAGTGAVATISAALEYPKGTLTLLTFNGSADGSIPDNTMLACDPIGVSVPTGAEYTVEYFFRSAGGIPQCYGAEGQLDSTVTGDNCQLDTGALTNTTMTLNQAITNTTSGKGYRPCAVLGWTFRGAVLASGDSLFRGNGDGGFPQASSFARESMYGYIGYLEKSIGDQCAYIISGVGGETVQAMAAGNAAYDANRRILAGLCTVVIGNACINDFIAGRTAANVKADTNTFAARYGLPYYQCTPTPYVTVTSDGYTTYLGQSTGSIQAARATALGEMRAGKYVSVSGIFDVAGVLEAGTDSALWLTWPTARVTADGASTAASKTITSASAAFTEKDIGALLYLATAGASGGALTFYITKVNSATSVDVSNNATGSVTGQALRIGYNQITADGTHAAPGGCYEVRRSRVIDVRGLM